MSNPINAFMPIRSLVYCAIVVACVLVPTRAHADQAAAVASVTQANIDHGEFPVWWTPDLPPEIQRHVNNKAGRLTERLQLADADQRAKVASQIAEHYGRVWAWHQQVDEKLDVAWAAWDAARDNRDGKEKDELRALTVMTEQVDPIYATFAPQIQGFLRSLQAEVGEAKTIELLDMITRSPGAQRTYDAYLGMVPELTDTEKAVLWGRMVQAREDSLAAWSDKRIVKIFKKYKVRNEFSIDYFGYGYRERYQAWASRK